MINMDEFSKALVQVFQYVLPEAVLGVAACVLFVGGTFRTRRHLWGSVAMVGLLAAGALFLLGPGIARPSNQELFAAPLLFDSLAWLIKAVALVAGVALLLMTWNEVPERQVSDFHGCLLLIIAGTSLTAAANDLITLFLGLELISIPTYVLLYLPKHDAAGQEAALKYFLLSVFSSALLLFGFSYLYGLAGTTNIAALIHTLIHAMGSTPSKDMPVITLVALVLVLAGLGFRMTAVPFHFYAPDVFQGTSLGGAALLSFVPKVAGFVALLRVLGFVVPAFPLELSPPDVRVGLALSDQVPILLWFLAAVTMFLGNLLALLQDNLKRLLAYSSVAHAGYMLVALAVAPYLRQPGADAAGPDGVQALIYYLIAYGAMTLGAFGVIAYLSTPERPVETVDDLAGLSTSHPGIALLMVVFLFSLIGIPLTAGFTGKFLVFFGAMAVDLEDQGTLFRVLAVLGVINAAIGAWYYLRIVAVMYLRTALRPIELKRNWAGLGTVWICALLTVGLSIPPGADWLLAAARSATGARPANAAK
jgi:NADH-quinone oxidoreductase subunit N